MEKKQIDFKSPRTWIALLIGLIVQLIIMSLLSPYLGNFLNGFVGGFIIVSIFLLASKKY